MNNYMIISVESMLLVSEKIFGSLLLRSFLIKRINTTTPLSFFHSFLTQNDICHLGQIYVWFILKGPIPLVNK